MKSILGSLLTAVTLVLVTAGLSFGQTTTVATWPLESDTTVTVSSNVTAQGESVVGLQAAYEVPPSGTTSNVQKLKPDATTSDTTNGTGAWPVDTTFNMGRYVEFSFTPQTSYTVTLDSLSMMIGAKGIKGMNASIFYSMKSDFSDSVKLVEVDSLVENAVGDTSFALGMAVESGETLYIRVFPWTSTSSTSTSKYMYIGDMVASGAVSTLPMAVASGSNELWNFAADSVGVSYSVLSWGPGNAYALVAPDTITPSATGHILKFINNNYNSAPILKVVLPAGKTLANYSSLSFKAFFAQGDITYKTFYVQAYTTLPTGHFVGSGNAANIGSYDDGIGAPSTGWVNISIPIAGSFSMSDTVYIVFGNNASGSSGGLQTIWYASDIQLVGEVTTSSPITMWGIAGRNNPGWSLKVSSTGDTATFGGGLVQPWAAIRGAFKHPLVGTTDKNGAVVVSGKVTFVGGGPIGWSGLRYGIFNNLTPGTLDTSVPDSTYWSGFSENSYGYMFTPQSGTAYVGNIPGGFNATQGITNGGSWISTYGGAIGFGGVIQQAPARADMTAGTYDFAFSVHPQTDGTRLVNFYLIKEGSPVTYWFGGSLVDTTSQTHSDTLNAICFGAEVNGVTATMTGMTFFDVVDSLGPDITVPKAPWQDYYISDWGIYGKNSGGWHLTPGELIGNATISGDTALPYFQHANIRGAFVSPATPINGTDSTLVVTGDLQFMGGGFPTPNSFYFGLFQNDNAGSLDSTETVGYQWTGANDMNYGYLFIPPSGSNPTPVWQAGTPQQGNFGAVVDGPWSSTVGNNNYVLNGTHQTPMGAMADSGNYSFVISVGPGANGGQVVTATLEAANGSYKWGAQATDMHNPLVSQKFNSVIFGLEGGNPTTGLAITNVQVEMAAPATVAGGVTAVNGTSSNLPKSFELYQNYPNPFNPSTTIRYDIPKTSQVTIRIYDVLGRLVETLVDGIQPANSYSITWNSSRLSSGLYFCRIEAHGQNGSGDFTSVKKLLFMK